MSRLQSEPQTHFHIAKENSESHSTLQTVPLSFRRKSLDQFDSEFRLDQKSKIVDASSASKGNGEQAELLINASRFLKSKDYEMALSLFRAVLRADPTNEYAIQKAAECESLLGRHEEAILQLRSLVDNKGTASNFKILADQLYGLGYYQDAVESYLRSMTAGLEEGPELFDALKNTGNALLKLGDINGAEEYYNKAYTMDPESDALLVNFGSLALYRGDLQKAIARFREAVILNDRNEKAWIGLGMIHREFGDVELSWANLEKALDLDPSNESGVKLATEWAMKDNEIDKAIRRLEAYLIHRKEDAQAQFWLAKYLYLAGHLASAYEKIRIALQIDPVVDGGTEVLKVIREEMKAKGIELK